MAEINHQMMDSDDENLSVHSAISNPSDFAEDEEVDYLALELLHHLPAEKADKLMKSLRAKEKAVQDLVARNRSLLNSCEALDEENQALTERLKEAEEVAAQAPEPPALQKAPSAPVDNSFFLQMERGKEETILRLTSENRKLADQVRRLSEGCKQMEEALVQARKDMKKVQQHQAKQPVQPSGAPQLDEEERLYRELQGESMGDLILQKLQEKQAEHRLKIQQALQASLAEEIGRIESWGSDVKGVLLAVDGLEAQLKHQLKEPKSKKTKAQPSDAKDSKGFNSDHITAMSAQLLDEFDLMKRSLETVEKEQLSLEQTLRAADDSAEPVAVAFELESSLATAESEAEWLREHNAAWVERCQSLSLQPMLDVLMRTDSALTLMVTMAPPGLMPPNVGEGVKETRAHMSKLSEQLQVQMSSIAQLQEESAALSRSVTSLQASQKAHKSELQQNVSDALKRTLATFEEPLEQMRSGLRHQSQVLVKARAEVSRVLDDLAAATHRAAAATQAPSKEAPVISAELQDFVMSEIRQVRSMGKKLVGNLEEGCKAVEARMQKVMEAIAGEPKNQSQNRQVAAPSKQGERENQTEAKKKRKKKGGGHVVKTGSGDKEHEEEHRPEDATPAGEPEAASTTQPGVAEAEGSKEDAAVGEEFQEASESPSGRSKLKRSSDSRDKVLAGANLLQELQSLRSDTEALEARMAERLQARAGRGGEDEEAKPSAAAARRRKKMFA